MLAPNRRRVLKQGWAHKRGTSRVTGWKLKWLVLLDLPSIQLLVFDQRDHAAQDLPPKHVITPVMVEAEPTGKSRAGRKGERTTPFKVLTKERKYTFAGQNKKDRDEWISFLQQCTGAAAPASPSKSPAKVPARYTTQRGTPSSYGNMSMDQCSVSICSYDADAYSITTRTTDVEALSIGNSIVLSAEELRELGRNPNSGSEGDYSRRKQNKLAILYKTPLNPEDQWNTKYQKLMARKTKSDEAAIQRDVKLCEVIGHFREIAQIQGQKIIDEYHSTAQFASTNDEMQTIFPGTVVVGEVLFHFAANYDDADPEAIEAAEKKANHELKAINALNRCETDLRAPFSCILDYKGFRLVAYAIMPFEEDKTLVFDVQSDDPRVDDTVLQKLAKLARGLNLQDHTVDLATGRRIQVPVGRSVQVHYCNDMTKPGTGSYYAVKLAETFPLDVVKKVSDRGPPPNRQNRLRPEFVKDYPNVLSSDAFNMLKSRREREKTDAVVLKACKYLRENWIPTFVEKLDQLDILPIDSLSLTQEMHRHGINMRYTGTVASLTKLPYIRELCSVEMVSRACKKIFRTRLRRAVFHFRSVEANKVDDEMKGYVVNLFNTVLGNSDNARKFWDERLGQVVQDKFAYSLDLPSFLNIHRSAMFLSMQYHCGVTFQDHIDYDFLSPSPLQKQHFIAFNISVKQVEGRHQKLVGKLGEEEVHIYELARHMASLGPKAKLSKNELTAMRFNSLVRNFNASERYEEARLYGYAALNLAGKNHAGTALVLMNLLETDYMLSGGELLDSEMTERYRGALAVLGFHWGEDHPLAITVHDKMAQLYCKGGQNERGYEYHNLSMTTAFRILGKHHPVSAMHLTKAGYILLAMRQNDEAIQKFQEALDIFCGLEPDSENVAENHHCIAEALFDKGDIDGTIRHSQEAKRIREKNYGQLHPKSVETYQQLAKAMLASYTHYQGVITPVIKQSYMTAISCYEKVFKYLKSPASSSGMGGSGSNGSTADNMSMRSGAASVSPSKDSALLDLTRTLISLKLRLIPSQHRELLRTLRAQEADVQYPEELVKEVILRLVHLTPCVMMDNVFQRVEDQEPNAVEEFAICVQIAEKSNLTLVV